MAIYGVDLYAKSYYGYDIPVQFSVQPFLANQLEHGNLHITWTTPQQVSTSTSAGKSWSSLRLIRNMYGFPVSATDGAILLEIPNTSPVESYLDTTAIAGRFAYYSIYVLTTHDAWDSSRTYSIGDMVTYAGQDWIAIAITQGQTPGSGSAWSATTADTEWVIAGSCVGLVIGDWQYSEFLYSHTPRAYKVNVVETTASNPDFNNHLWKFDQIFGFGFDIMKTENDALLRINDIELTRDRFIVCMAEQMGIGEELPDEPVQRRLRIMDAVQISQQRGSLAGLLTLISDTTGWGASIAPGYNALLDVDQASFAHPSPEAWNTGSYYRANDLVTYNSVIYQASRANIGHSPDPSAIGAQPSSLTPEFWYQFKPKTSGWRGVYGSTTVYAVGDVVVSPSVSTTNFYTCAVANGPGTAAGVQAPASATNTWWTASTTTTDDRSNTITFAGVWASSGTYTTLKSVVLSGYNPGDPIWIATANSSGTNLYWTSAAGLADPTGALIDATTSTIAGWGAWTSAGSSNTTMGVVLDGVPATSTTPARNCMSVHNTSGSAIQTGVDSIWTANYHTWSAASAWVPGNVVTYNGVSYICVLATPATSTTPNNDSAHWALYTPKAGENLATQYGVPLPRVRAWDHNRTYNPGDKVAVNGNIYQATYSTTGSSPSGYRFDSRGWRWIGPEQVLYTASLYYQRQSPSGSTSVLPAITWYGPANNRLVTMYGATYPPLYTRFSYDGPIGGTDPGTYTAPTYGNPVPITWILEGGPWRVDDGVVHTTYPATYNAGQILVMPELVYGTARGSDPVTIYATLVQQSYLTNHESGIVFNLNPTTRTYWMASNTRLTKNTYASDFSSVSITQVATWTALPNGSRLIVTITGNNLVGKTGAGVALFSVTDTFSNTGTLHGIGERPTS